MSSYIKEIKNITDVACEVIGLEICNHPAIIPILDHDITYNSEADVVRIRLPKLSNIGDIRLNFNECLQVVYDISSALAYLRLNGIMHRDIKEQNIMIRIVDGHIRGILIDFNLCTFIVGSLFLKPCSTVTHRAPEVYNSLFNSNADVWSLGFFIYSLVAGHSWKDMAYDAGWFTAEFEEKEWLDFVTNPATLDLIKQTILACDNGMTDNEKVFFIRLICGCLQIDEYRITETNIIDSVEKYYPGQVVKINSNIKMIKREAAALSEKIVLSDRCAGVIKMQVSYLREHIYGVLNYTFTHFELEERLIYTLIYSMVFMYDNNELNIWEFPSNQDFVDLHHCIKNWRLILFV